MGGGGGGPCGSYSKLINGLTRLPVALFMPKSELTVHMIICKKSASSCPLIHDMT